VRLSQSRVSELETGQRALKAEELYRIAGVLDLPLAWFFEEFAPVEPSGSRPPTKRTTPSYISEPQTGEAIGAGVKATVAA
jgi:transcriptional regulator with XRE-family HTH domain